MNEKSSRERFTKDEKERLKELVQLRKESVLTREKRVEFNALVEKYKKYKERKFNKKLDMNIETEINNKSVE